MADATVVVARHGDPQFPSGKPPLLSYKNGAENTTSRTKPFKSSVQYTTLVYLFGRQSYYHHHHCYY
jgi:hypothetical protein